MGRVVGKIATGKTRLIEGNKTHSLKGTEAFLSLWLVVLASFFTSVLTTATIVR